MVRQDPAHASYSATFWAVAMSVLALADRLGLHLSAASGQVVVGSPPLTMPLETDPLKAAKQ
jgi:hypothetical protein